MPIYDFACPKCKWEGELNVPIMGRDFVQCQCGTTLDRLLSAPMGRIAGRTLPGGGPDRFTADVLGISDLRDLPEGLKTK